MVIVTFPNRATERKALGFLLGRFSGRVLKSGEHIIPEAALEALAQQDVQFSVKGSRVCFSTPFSAEPRSDEETKLARRDDFA